jgi:hypothetical protein
MRVGGHATNSAMLAPVHNRERWLLCEFPHALDEAESVACTRQTHWRKKDDRMQAEPDVTMADTSTLKLPEELLTELKRHARLKTDFRVESLKPSLLERLLGLLGLK